MWRSLLYTSWLETRSRFLWGSLLVLGTVSNSIFQGPKVMRAVRQQLLWLPMPFPRYLWETVYHGSLLATWIAFVVLLGLGGLRREHSTGNSVFTLSLTMRRSKFLQAQAVVALAEALVMGFLPALLVPALSRLIGQTFAIDQAILLYGLAGGRWFGLLRLDCPAISPHSGRAHRLNDFCEFLKENTGLE